MPIAAIAVAGPTASGKTALSLPLAERFEGEILCCDSMQIYRGMDIGTAKATEAERQRVPHHLLDMVAPNESYSAAEYAHDAMKTALEVVGRGHLPIFVGGTGLYLEAARTGRHGEPMESDPAFRKAMAELAEREGAEGVYRLLCERDPESAEAIHPNNVKRVIRALEIHHVTGCTKSELDRKTKLLPPAFNLCLLYLTFEDRELLYRRIRLRVEEMFRMGLADEVRTLLARGMLPEGGTAAQAIGYKEILSYLRGECSESEAMDAVTLATRHYAKRQITWFSAKEDAHPIQMDRGGKMRSAEDVVAEATAIVQNFLNANNCLQ